LNADCPESLATTISLTVKTEQAAEFYPLLQRGFGIKASVPCTIRELLCNSLGLDYTYVAERITTIFLNGKATDSMADVIGEGSTIALSAAMPGLVGATMRRGSYYAAMRSSITCRDTDSHGARRQGMVRIKLFNLLLDELGTSFLSEGIFVTSSELENLFRGMPDIFWDKCDGAAINGESVAAVCLKESNFPGRDKTLILSIVFT